MNDLAQQLARQARKLGLDATTTSEADPELLREFAQLVLEELAARGLIAGQTEIGCWAVLRSSGH